MDGRHGVSANHRTTRYEREACAALERLAAEGRAGRVFGREELTPLEWELLLVYRAREQEHELLYRSDLADLVDALKPRG